MSVTFLVPMIAVGSAEWLQRTSFSADSAIAELCGRLACLTAWLRRSGFATGTAR